jgi:hypothetical protein
MRRRETDSAGLSRNLMALIEARAGGVMKVAK